MENENIVINKLEMIQQQLAKIAEYIEDITLTKDDLESIEEAKRDLKEGKTRRL